jgi:hypothetical protein
MLATAHISHCQPLSSLLFYLIRGGWHHVEVHDAAWWISKFESYGFRYSAELTQQAKKRATLGKSDLAPDGKAYRAQHLWLHILVNIVLSFLIGFPLVDQSHWWSFVSAPSILQVFINPAVAGLPEHAHLFAEDGCFVANGKPNRRCGGQKGEMESKLPDSFLPIQLTPEMDTAWENHVFRKTSL